MNAFEPQPYVWHHAYRTWGKDIGKFRVEDLSQRLDFDVTASRRAGIGL